MGLLGAAIRAIARLPLLHRSNGAGELCALAALLLLFAATSEAAPTKSEEVGEYDLKAALLVKVTAFVTWPGEEGAKDGNSVPAPEVAKPAEGGEEQLCVGVIGSDPFGPVLDDLLKRAKTDHRDLEARRVADPSQASACQIWFVSASEREHTGEILTAAASKGVLTISDLPGFARAGGMVELALEGTRISLLINKGAVERAGLSVSSKLLSLAKVVGEENGVSQGDAPR